MEFSRPLNSPLIFESFTLISFYHYVAVAVIRSFIGVHFSMILYWSYGIS